MEVQRTVRSWQRTSGDSLPAATRKEVALALLRGGDGREKLAGMAFFADDLLPSGELTLRDLSRFPALFREDALAGGAVCDLFAVQVLGPWIEAGANGFGLGSGVFKPGKTPAQVLESARAYVAALTK